MKKTKSLTPERIMQLAWGYAPPLILEAAVKHRVFDLLDESPKTVTATRRKIRRVRARPHRDLQRARRPAIFGRAAATVTNSRPKARRFWSPAKIRITADF